MTDHVSPARRSAMMRAVKGKNTTPELLVRRAAHRMGLRFRLHGKRLPGTPDLVFKRWRTVVFVNGCFWHRHPGCPRRPCRSRTWNSGSASSTTTCAEMPRIMIGWRNSAGGS